MVDSCVAHSLITRGIIPSGPAPFLAFRFLSNFSTVFASNWLMGGRSVEFVEIAGLV